ncbi:hypothetical protein [Jannaschia pohangensis]|uniref:TRAP-type mannitol/chloroaromatic compound transport system, substrate-binding protein n=1 Tax=Jannaschia pohangensis TaxID=390807 RepID=A0A1I3V2Z0_9RHOB|nr:hypothetical protein [Jannaschia pohangensis]SFJ89818.1 TRAP-type mannitol/chloroaromatic compound transport system, substrate-binding protein [Jannaschia pohangensis]
MKRRNVLGLGFGLGGAALAAPALAQTRTTLALVTDREAPARVLADRLSAVTDGALSLDVRVTPADSRAFLSQVGEGQADMYMGSEEDFVDTHPAFGLFAAMPGGMSTSELEGWISASDGRLMWDDLSAEHGVKAFLAGCDGPQPIWSRAPLTGPGDLTGGRVGSTGLGLRLMAAMGAGDVVDIRDGGDLSGLDALEGLSLLQMRDAGLLESFPHMTAANVSRPMSGRSVGVNLAKWEGLTDADRLLLESCITASHGMDRIKALHEGALAARDAAITTHAMPAEIWAAQTAATNAVMTAILDTNDIGADAADAYLYFLTDVAGWSEIGEAAFTQGRNRELSQ